VHANLVVSRVKIKLGEVLGATQLIQQLLDDHNRKFVLDHFGVEHAVVDSETQGVVRLLHKQDRRRKGRGAGPDNALLKHLGTLSFQLCFLCMRIAVGSYRDWSRAGSELDLMASHTLWW
jgi:hypothetical protein